MYVVCTYLGTYIHTYVCIWYACMYSVCVYTYLSAHRVVPSAPNMDASSHRWLACKCGIWTRHGSKHKSICSARTDWHLHWFPGMYIPTYSVSISWSVPSCFFVGSMVIAMPVREGFWSKMPLYEPQRRNRWRVLEEITSHSWRRRGSDVTLCA